MTIFKLENEDKTALGRSWKLCAAQKHENEEFIKKH